MKKASTNESISGKLSKQQSKVSIPRSSKNSIRKGSLKQLNPNIQTKKTSESNVAENKQLEENNFKTKDKVMSRSNSRDQIQKSISKKSSEEVNLDASKNEPENDKKQLKADQPLLDTIDNVDQNKESCDKKSEIEQRDIDFDQEENNPISRSEKISATNDDDNNDLFIYKDNEKEERKNFLNGLSKNSYGANIAKDRQNNHCIAKNIFKSQSTSRNSSLRHINGLTQSQFIMKKNEKELKQFDEINYLKQKLKRTESDKMSFKHQYRILCHEEDDLKAKIHKIKYQAEIDAQSKKNISPKDNLNLIKVLNYEKSKRESIKRKKFSTNKENELKEKRKLEENEKQKNLKMVAEKRKKMLVKLETIKKRGEERELKNNVSNKLVNDLLASKNDVLTSKKEDERPIKISNIYKF